MTDDIVTRLRQAYKDADEVTSVFLTNEAANHIEDLVSQLRIQAEAINGKNYHTISGGLHLDAADEIEHLRKMLREAGKALTHVSAVADRLQMTENKLIETHQTNALEKIMEQACEIERLQAELAQARTEITRLERLASNV